jgi:hypothetical protein
MFCHGDTEAQREEFFCCFEKLSKEISVPLWPDFELYDT